MSNIIPFKSREQLKKEKQEKIWEEWLEWERFEEEREFIKQEEKIARKEVMRNKPNDKSLSLSPAEWDIINKLLGPEK